MSYLFEPEHRTFLYLLYKYQVDYMLIGGVAVNLYGYSRGTGDLDILFSPSDRNKQQLIFAIDEFGYDTTEFEKKSVNEITMFTLGERTDQGHIELTNRIAGIRYEEASLRKQQISIDGLTVSYIHYRDLLKNKQAAGRQKDLVDVKKLQQIRRIQENYAPNENKKVSFSSLWQKLRQIITLRKDS